jgi:hypothetical protein
MISLILTREFLDAVAALVRERCPCALEDPEFLPTLVALVEDELTALVRARCWKFIRKAGEPCPN